MPTTVHVISPVTGTGNRLDLELVAPLLEQSGFAVTRYPVRNRGRRARYTHVARTLLRHPLRFDLNLFLGALLPELLPLGRKNVWIPNPEGFDERLRKWLPRIDYVLIKMRSAERIYGELGCKTKYVGFTSRDYFDPQVTRDYTRFFHAHSSQFKGTPRLLEVWAAHPEWPELVVASTYANETITGFQAANICILRNLPDAEYRQLQKSIGFHLCCSETDGWGHYIVEAMGCGAVTFTTNAPPMNEHVQPDRGILVDCLAETRPFGLAQRYAFKAASLEEQVRRALKLDRASLEQISSSARAFFLENDRRFRQNFPVVIRSVIEGASKAQTDRPTPVQP
jgi:glycosyltransferase involved in cell wall biosynthesis